MGETQKYVSSQLLSSCEAVNQIYGAVIGHTSLVQKEEEGERDNRSYQTKPSETYSTGSQK